MSVSSGRNMGVAAGLDIGIDANRNGRNFTAAPCVTFGLLEQNFQLCFGLDIEQQYSVVGGGFASLPGNR